MRDFGLSLRGRVKNFPLPENKSLIPLFEAVVNSLQAIAERQKTCDFLGEISILIDREDTLSEDIIGKIEDIMSNIIYGWWMSGWHISSMLLLIYHSIMIEKKIDQI